MSGFKLEGIRLEQWRELLCGDAEADVVQRCADELANRDAELSVFLAGLRELPTSLLGLALAAADLPELSSANEQAAMGDLAGADATQSTGTRDFTPADVRRALQQAVAEHFHAGAPPGAEGMRLLIDRLAERFLPKNARRDVLAAFLEAVSRDLESILVAMSHDRAATADDKTETKPNSGHDTVAAAGSTTIDLCRDAPREFLARQQRLVRLEGLNPNLARVYRFYTLAARTHAEIAELLELSVAEVTRAEQVATVEICFTDS